MRTRRRVHIGASSSADHDPASDYTEDDGITAVPVKKVKTKVIAAQKVEAALQSVRARNHYETSPSPNDLASDCPEDNETAAVPVSSMNYSQFQLMIARFRPTPTHKGPRSR